MPYCVSKELSLEILFLHTKRRETICSLFSTSEERPPVSCEDRCLQACSELLSCIHLKLLPHDLLLHPQLFLLACEHLIRIEEPPLLLVCSQSPGGSVKRWQSAVQFSSSRGPDQTATCVLLSSLVLTKRFHVHCSWF